MQIELNLLFEVTFIALLVKLIVGQWTPPIQKSMQALLVCGIGSATGLFLNPTREGFILGLVASAIAFYGKELTDGFKTTFDEIHGVVDKTQADTKK
jgi:hypothetical protein